jgi:hypothetical protein
MRFNSLSGQPGRFVHGLARLVVALMVSLGASSLCHAQTTPEFCIFPYRCPTAARLSPQVGQQGTEVTLLLQGARLQEIQDVLFYGPGLEYVSFEPVDQVPDDVTLKLREIPSGTAALLTLGIADDCPRGEHFLRIRTADELSEMLSFWVTPFQCVAETHAGNDVVGSTNGAVEHAQPIDLGTTVYGYHPKNSTIDHDFYSVGLRQGQRLTVEVWSSCLGFQHFRAMSDIAVTVHGPDGKKLAFADDSSLRDMDPLLNIKVPATGTYYINIHQNMDFEGILRHYVAHISDAPRPRITYPLGGQAGTRFNAMAIGDVAGSTPFHLDLPSQPGAFDESIVDWNDSGSVIANGVQVALFPDVLEDGGSHAKPEQAQVHRGELPVAFNGRIEQEGATDWFRFSARKGARYRIRTYAATLGSPLDARIQVRAAEGTDSQLEITADDSNWIDHDWWGKDKIWIIKDRMDPVTVFEPDADGDYLIGISDSQRLFGPEFAYRIEFQPLRDHAFVYFPTDYREAANKRDRLVIPRGNTIEHTLAIVHGTGSRYRGGIRVEAEGLPEGVTFSCPPLLPGQMLTQATMTAAPDAQAWHGLIDLKLKATDPEVEFTGSYVHNVPSTQRRGGNNVVFNRVRRCALAVVQQAPIHVRVKQPVIGLAQNAVIDLEVEVQRQSGFNGAVRVYAAWTPPGVTVSVPLVIPPGETSGVYRLRSSGSVEPGTYPITLTAQEDTGGERAWGTGFHFVASPPINLKVVRPYLDIALARTAIERQTTGQIIATIETIRTLPGEVTATLVRLPKGVELIAPVTIAPGDTTALFPVRITEDCLLGQYQEIGCEITIKQNGQTITQQTGSGTLRVDAERK